MPVSPNFLANAPRFLFFTGKGGVGKTSLACATAVLFSESGKRVLLVSTDPASNVGQVFGIAIGNCITVVPAVPNLWALEIDPQRAAQLYRQRVLASRSGTPPDQLKAIEEQLSGACTTEIAAFDEFTELLTDDGLKHVYDHVIFDTAPTGHTIRLLQLPGAWSSYLETGEGDASCLGPLAGLDKQRVRYRNAVTALGDPWQTRLVLVARAQQSSLREAERTHDELAALGLKEQFLVINGLLPRHEGDHDELAAAIYEREQQALAALPASLKLLPIDQLELKPFDLVGLDALRLLLTGTKRESELGYESLPALAVPHLNSLVRDIAAAGRGLIMVMGKGGVGKTTIAAAIAVRLAKLGLPVHLTTSDPAAHLADTLRDAPDNLMLSRIDPHAETARYRDKVMKEKGTHLDAAGIALLEEDLRSPCTEEVAVFHAFSRIVREGGRKFVVMDTAPTGHTLLLLDAAGAYHRDIVRQMSETGVRFSTPLMQLQDSAQTKVLLVTLAEKTPVLEAAGLQADLRRAGIEPWAWIVNNSIAAASPHSLLLRQRARNELREIEAVAARHAGRLAVIPLLKEEPVGVAKLLALTAEE